MARWRTTRLLAALGLLAGGLACTDPGCDCAAPLPAAPDPAERVYDALQLRLSPHAIDLVEAHLPELLAAALPEGLAFEVPPVHQLIDAWIFDIQVDICPEGCKLQAEIASAQLTPRAPDRLQLDMRADLSGELFMTGEVDCDISVHVRDKPVAADVVFALDGRDDLLRFDVSGVALELDENDFSLRCYGPLGGFVEAFQGVLVEQMNQQLADQLDSALADLISGATCLPCDFYTRCPPDAPCDPDGAFCADALGCRTRPLGLVGRVDAGALLGGLLPGLQAELDLEIAAGQSRAPTEDPVVVRDGLELRLLAGVDSAPSACVPEPEPDLVPPPGAAARLPMPAGDLVPGSDQTFDLALGAADFFLDRALYKAWRAGLLCIELTSDSTGGLLSTGTLSAFLPSLDALSGGRDAPMRLQLRPLQVPSIEIGAGTFSVDEHGAKVIDQPLLAIDLPEAELDFYARIDERWIKLATLTQDVSLWLGLELLPDNRLLPVFDESSIRVQDVRARDHELLAEEPEQIESLLPLLLELALPELTGSLGVVELPAVEGFVPRVLAVEPAVPRDGEAWFDFLVVYADLELEAGPPAGRRVRARADRIPVAGRKPSSGALSVAVEADRGPQAEFSWRLDGGGWSVFQPGPELRVASPLLALPCEHRLEVRARSACDYRTLGERPVEIVFAIEPSADDALPETQAAPPKRPASASRQALPMQAQAEPEPAAGCASPGGRAAGWPGLALALACLLWWIERRYPS
ncbi:MAG: hypothetical protein JXR96_13555 [Deltaproteobacteria bacterium]|nr:hypothetical protein [Deltaproteobacteria bacterium]